MKIDFKKLAISILIPLAVGGLSGFLTRGAMEDFSALSKPALSPPGWLFPVVWTILYILMGIAFYIVWQSDSSNKSMAKLLYYIQLGMNFFWSIIFFNLEAYGLSFIWLVVLLIFILLTTLVFYSVDKRAGYLLIPYIVWVAFAGYLNLAIYILNR